MKTRRQRAASAAFVAASALLIAGCGAQKVSGRTYLTADGDTIEFAADGKAAERNANPGVIYAGQSVAFGADGITAMTPCSYTQDGDKIALTCEGAAKTIFTVNDDGSLAGPPEGLYAHKAFAHLAEKR